MTKIKMEVVFTSPSMCQGKDGKLHTRLASPGQAKGMEDLDPNRVERSVWPLYINDSIMSTKLHKKPRVFASFSLLRHHCSLLHPELRRAAVNERAGLQNHSLWIRFLGRAIKVRLLKDLHHGSSIVQVRCCSESSSVTPSAALRSQDPLCLVCVVHLSEGKSLVRTLLFNLALNHGFWYYDLAVFYC